MTVGKKVKIDRTDLYYEIEDNDHEVTIVFESGYGWSLDNWDPVRREGSEFANLFFYDRNGVGESERSDISKDSLQSAINLKKLLLKAEVYPPFLLIGHSYGGVIVRLFANLYPELVSGVILLDSVHEDQNHQMVPLFDHEVQQEYLEQFHVEATLTEFEESLEQVRGSDLSSVPLVVMTGGTQPHHTSASMRKWMDFQRKLKELSTDSKHVFVEEAGHAIHHDDPQAVLKVVRDMVEGISCATK
ncbi:alpha/beta fold hydrolase [Guptibacillus algicola]|uniref:alpha/beta fold hydrolase n=1 Tax=Guptibacillus algicola TaxID=225844 RepID=UPI001CD5415D|nr:alpha/beta hydrolase [Alkalihalobacillus algicola]MCA0987522.1 alpha/beta hydrolase [Alkalihalobacillus algicola]